MLTEHTPASWQSLQEKVGEILRECGYDVEIEKKLKLVRGAAEIDVYASGKIDGRASLIVCECNNWQSAVPQTAIHSFRTVVADCGAHIGYMVSSGGFQSGAESAAQMTNLRLLTWPDFQEEFQEAWLRNYMMPQITERLDPLMTFTEPLPPTWFREVPEEDAKQLAALVAQHRKLGMLAMQFSTYAMKRGCGIPTLPVLDDSTPVLTLPDSIKKAKGYKDLFDEMVKIGESAIAQFREIRNRNGLSGGE